MPSPTYNNLLNLLSGYLDSKKAAEVLGRQLTACQLTAETLSSASLAMAAVRVSTACSLYIADAGKREELKKKLAAL